MAFSLLHAPRMTEQERELIGPPSDPAEAAQAAGLRYVSDALPGLRRKRAGKGFSYIGLDGKPLRDEQVLERIRKLGIPPAWTDVWICPNPNGHIQATGRDARGRKQYRYHERWRQVRDENKYGRMIAFARALPQLRARVAEHLALPGLPREKVLATIVRLLESTLIRIGNAEYARSNKSFGLTTLRDQHVDISGSNIRFTFRGKSGKEHAIDVRDRHLARIVRRCRDIPGYELFQYLDEQGQRVDVTSDDVNGYLREISDQDFTAKDFRTWGGTIEMAQLLRELGPATSETDGKQKVTQAIKGVAERLGNTPTICRKCYVHPAVVEAYLDGSLLPTLEAEELEGDLPGDVLPPDEEALLDLLIGRSA
jgi:DNA topoisomerase-1